MALAMPLLLAGCYTWSTNNSPSREDLASLEGEHVQVGVEGKARFDLHDVTTVGDSLVGTTGAGDRYAVSTDDVVYVRHQETDNAKTGLLIGGVMVSIGLLAVAAFDWY